MKRAYANRPQGPANTRKVKLTKRRKKIRELLGDIPEGHVRRIAEMDDPIARYEMMVAYSRAQRLSIETQKNLDEAFYIVVLNELKDEQKARDYISGGCDTSPDDRKYRPKYIDPVLRGPGRATGIAAQAIKSRKTVTDWQYDERNQDHERH